jgi:hypothetical protein
MVAWVDQDPVRASQMEVDCLVECQKEGDEYNRRMCSLQGRESDVEEASYAQGLRRLMVEAPLSAPP